MPSRSWKIGCLAASLLCVVAASGAEAEAEAEDTGGAAGPAAGSTAFVQAFQPAVTPPGPNIFGTIALPVRVKPTSTRWAKVMRASLDQPVLDQMVRDARTLSPEQELDFVQGAVFRTVRTAGGSNNCSDDGYWAPAQETLARGMGDCFDVAIAKMEALRLLGIPAGDLYLTTGWFQKEALAGPGRESAALLVRIGERFWLLPEHSDRALASNGPEAGDLAFTPVLTYGVGRTWVHGKLIQASAPAVLAGAAAVDVAR